MSVLFIFLRNLLLTVLIEGALVLVFCKSKKTLWHSVLVNMLTNPLVNLCLLLWAQFAPLPEVPFYYIALALFEVSAFLAEGVLYYKMGDFGIKKAFLASLALNAASFLFGFLL